MSSGTDGSNMLRYLVARLHPNTFGNGIIEGSQTDPCRKTFACNLDLIVPSLDEFLRRAVLVFDVADADGRTKRIALAA